MEFETKTKIASGIVALASISVGGLIYLTYRPLTLLMFEVIDACHMMWVVDLLRDSPPQIPDWVEYSLPGGLWVFTYIVYMGIDNHFHFTKRCRMMLPVLPAIGIGSELMQCRGIMPGTFDMNDVIAYALGTAFGLLYIKIVELTITNKTISVWKQ